MNNSKNSVNGMSEILATDVYQAVPITLATPEEGTVVRAGSPITAEGAVTTGEDAVGILLYDVDTDENPNGAVIVSGFINSLKAQAWSGITYAVDAMKSAIPAVKFRPNIKNESGGDTPSGDDVVGTAIVGTSRVRAAS